MPVLTLVRHGETKLNRANVVQSRTPGELTGKGICMAETLGQHLQNEKFTKIYTSDLKRCHDTTLNILKHSKHEQPEPVLKEVLRERDYGDLEFQPGTTVTELIQKFKLPNHMVPIPGGEDYEDVMKRCAKFFEEICHLVDHGDVTESENILVVSHGAWILTFLDFLVANPDNFELHDYDHEKASKIHLLNTGNTKFHIESMRRKTAVEVKDENDADGTNNNNDGKRRIKFYHYHCVKHLENMKYDGENED